MDWHPKYKGGGGVILGDEQESPKLEGEGVEELVWWRRLGLGEGPERVEEESEALLRAAWWCCPDGVVLHDWELLVE